MSRATSNSAYAQIVESGLLGELHTAVYKALDHLGSATAREVWAYLKNETDFLADKESDCVTPRFAELKKRGVVMEFPKRKCSVSGMQAIEWAVVPGQLPKKVEKTKLNKKKIEDMEAFIKNRGLWAQYVQEFGE